MLNPIRLLSAGCLCVVMSGCVVGSRVEHRNVAFDVSPDGEKIVFSAADNDLYTLNLKTNQVEPLTQTPITESGPSFSPDGKSVLYSVDAPNGKGQALYRLTLNDKALQRLTTDTTVSDCDPAFSADGTKITFARAHWYREYSMGGMVWRDWDVYVMNADGTEVKRLTTKKYYGMSSPNFTRDSKAIVYSGDAAYPDAEKASDTLRTLLQVSVENPGEPTVLLPLPKRPKPGKSQGAMGSDPDLATDGTRIAFISDKTEPFSYDVCTVKSDGSDWVSLKVTSTSGYNQQPRYLPDGKSVLYLAGTESNAGSRPIFSLWQVNTDGGNAHQVADSSLFTAPLNWKPKPAL